ncbi:MAG: hypothetical protein ACOX05_04820 [Bacillota bacterium]
MAGSVRYRFCRPFCRHLIAVGQAAVKRCSEAQVGSFVLIYL